MTRVETIVQCTDCKTEWSQVDAVEERPGFWIHKPTVAVPVECPVCAGMLTRKESMEKFEAQRVHFEQAKEESIKRKPGGVQHVR